MEADKLLKELTLKEKILLCSGSGFWKTQNIDRLSIASIEFANFGYGDCQPSHYENYIDIVDKNKHTCFPFINIPASTWDNTLSYRLGLAVAEEALSKNISVVLLPNINIKRDIFSKTSTPYFSEDPILSGELMASFIQGLQFRGIAGCLRYFGSFSQEFDNYNAVIDERAMHELYLYSFEIAVKKGRPWSVMTSCNSVNGVYSSENNMLIRDTLRGKWGYRNVIFSELGPQNNTIASIKNGVGIEIPQSFGYSNKKIVNAIKSGILDIGTLDNTVIGNLNFIINANERKKENFKYNEYLHKSLAKKIVAESTILLKNTSNTLPLSRSISKKKGIVVIGQYAKNPQIKINDLSHTTVDSMLSEFDRNDIKYQYAKGYDSKSDKLNKSLLQEAISVSNEAYRVVLFLTPSEAHKNNFEIDKNQLLLLEEIYKVNKNIIVILYGYNIINMPWIAKVKAILHARTTNLHGGAAIVDLLLAEINPSAKTSETYIKNIKYNPSYNYLEAKDGMNIQYRESLFLGYRYYNMLSDKDKKEAILFPFGYGLSYTTFEYKKIKLSQKNTTVQSLLTSSNITVSFELTNIGNYNGSEVVQLYVSQKNPTIEKPNRQLRGFEKVFLKKGESKALTFKLNYRAFAHYDIDKKNWDIESGTYFIEIGTSSEDILLTAKITVEKQLSSDFKKSIKANIENKFGYNTLAGLFNKNTSVIIEDNLFDSLFKDKIDNLYITKTDGLYTINSTLEDIKHTFLGKILYKKITKKVICKLSKKDNNSSKPLINNISKMPIRIHIPILGKYGSNIVASAIAFANKKYILAIKSLFYFL